MSKDISNGKEREFTEYDLKTVHCPKFCCQGFIGMDRCNICDETGSGFLVEGKFFPNTKEGAEKAVELANKQ